MIKKIIYISAFSLLLFSCKNKDSKNDLAIIENVSTDEKSTLLDKNATVYTTAKDSDKRLSFDTKKIFTNASQPLETEVAIFVNPEK